VVAQQTGSGPALVASSATGDHFRASHTAGQTDLNPVARVTNDGSLLVDGTISAGTGVISSTVAPPFNAFGDPAANTYSSIDSANDLFVEGQLATASNVYASGIIGNGFMLGPSPNITSRINDVTFAPNGLGVPNGFIHWVSGHQGTGIADVSFKGFHGRLRVTMGDPLTTMGVGRQPVAQTLEVEGNASKTTAGAWLANSDARLKTDVLDLDDPLRVVRRLRPVSFRYSDEFLERHPGVKDVRYHNFVAQEFQRVFPDSVQDDGEGFLQMDSHPANVYAIGAIQQLERQLQDAVAEIAALRTRLTELEARKEAP
jgi:hypothetical protein